MTASLRIGVAFSAWSESSDSGGANSSPKESSTRSSSRRIANSSVRPGPGPDSPLHHAFPHPEGAFFFSILALPPPHGHHKPRPGAASPLGKREAPRGSLSHLPLHRPSEPPLREPSDPPLGERIGGTRATHRLGRRVRT